MDRETLQRYRYNRLELQRIELQLEDLDGDLAPSAARITGMPGGGKQSPDAGMIAVIQRRAELLQRYLDLKAELLTEQGRIELAIHRMPEPWRIILAYRYLVGLSWRKIEDATHYSYPHLQRLHREALERLKGMR